MRKSFIFLTLVLGLVILFGFKANAQITQVTSAGVTLLSNNARSVVKDGLGNYYVAFKASNNIYIRKSDDGGNTWKYWNGTAFDTTGSETYIVNVFDWNTFTMAVDSSNNLHLVYSYAAAGLSYIKYTAGGSWSSGPSVASGAFPKNPSITMDGSNNIHAVWYEGIGSPMHYQVRYSKYNGSSWSSPVNLTSENYDQSVPSITVDSSNNPHVVWYGYSAASPSYYQIRYTKYSGGSWTSPVDLTSGNYDQYTPSIVIDGSNNPHVVWYGYSSESPSNLQIRYIKYSGGTWISMVDLTTGSYSQSSPSIAVDGSDNLHMAWYGYNAASPSKYQIRYIKYSGGAWYGPVEITTGSYDEKYASITEDGSALIWQGTTDGNGVSSASYSIGLMFGTVSSLAIIPTQMPNAPVVADVGSNDDGRDMSVTFKGNTDETNVQEYRIIVVPNSSTIDDTSASGLASSRYVVEAKNGNDGNHNVTLTQGLLDSSGISIGNGMPYRVYILAVGQNGQPNRLSLRSAWLYLTSSHSGGGIGKITPAGVTLLSNNAHSVVRDGLGNYYAAFKASNNIYIRKSDDGGNTWKYWNGTAFDTTGPETYIVNVFGWDTFIMEVDSSNNLHLVYSYAASGLRYKKYTAGGSWSSGPNIGSGAFPKNPSIVIDSSNDIYVVWDDVGIWYAKYSSGVWSSPVNIASGNYPSIAVDGSGNIHVVCNNGGSISYTEYTSGSWTSTANIATGYYPSIAVDSSNNIHVVYGNTSIYYISYSGGTWSSPTKLSDNTYYSFSPSVGIDNSGNITVIWNGYSLTSPSKYQIRYSKYSSGSWAGPVGITSGSFDQEYSNITKDGSAFVWQGTTNGAGVSSTNYNTGLMFYISVIPTLAPGTPSAVDIANNGDGRDIQVTFTGAVDETNISGYRIFVVKSTDTPSFGSSTASGLASSRYSAVAVTTAGASHTVTLTQNLLDSSGAAIQNGVAYKVFVLSVGKTGYSDMLSSGSSSLTLALTIQGITTMTDAVSDLANNGDGRDIRVMFKGSPNELNIQGYRVIVVRKAIADSFDVVAASGLLQTSYIAELAKGKARMHLFYLTQALQDSEGNPITGSVAYRVYVLAVGKVGYSNALTSLGDITLDTNNEGLKVEALKPTVADIANNGNGTDLRVTFRKPRSEANIASYKIIVSTTDLTLITAASAPAKQITATGPTVSYTASIGSTQTDENGVAIKNDTAYKVYILAIGSHGYANVLSTPSKLITLSQYVPGAYAIRSLKAAKAGSGHDSSNISVSFFEPTTVNNVQEYRVFIAPSGNTLSQTTAEGISNALLYQVVATTKRGAYHGVILTAGKNDCTNVILAAGDYKVYVLTVGQTGYSGKLSAASGIVKLD